MKKIVAYCGFNFSNDSAYLRMPDAFSSQPDKVRLEIVNQLIEELMKVKEQIHFISQLETQNVFSD
jgi:hypothetical protein